MAAIFIPLANLTLYCLRLSTLEAVGISSLVGFSAAILWYTGSSIFYFSNSQYLPDPPRQISVRKQIKIIKYLEPYGNKKPKGSIPRSFDLSYYPGVMDAGTFGKEIRDVMRRAGWAANLDDDEAKWERPEHAKGLWVYGKGIKDQSPSNGDLLQEAFKRAGFKVHVDHEDWGIPGTVFVIGFWE